MPSGNWAVSRWPIGRSSERHPRQRCGARPKTPGRKKFSARPGGFLNLHSQHRFPAPSPWIGGLPPADLQGEEMPGSGTSTFIDPDDYQASLDRVPLDLLLVTSRGEFKAGVTSARLNHLYLLSSEEYFPRIAYVSLSPALVFVGFPTRSSPPIIWSGVELHPGEIVLHSRAERFHQRTTGPS